MVLLGHFLGKNSVPNVDRKPNWMLRTDWFYSKRRRIWKLILLPEQQARWINVKIVKLPLVISSASSGTVMEKNSYHQKLMKCYHNEVLAHYPIWKLLCVQDYCTWNQWAYIFIFWKKEYVKENSDTWTPSYFKVNSKTTIKQSFFWYFVGHFRHNW